VAKGIKYFIDKLESEPFVVHLILLIFTVLVSVLIIIAAVRRWIDQSLVIDTILLIFGTFLGAGLLKYAQTRR